VTLPIIRLTPLQCPDELTYSLQKQDSSSLESQFTLNATSKIVNVYSTEPLLTGNFPLRVVLTDSRTGVTENVNFQVTIKCSKAINLLTNPISPLSYNVGTTNLIVEQMLLPTYEPQPSDCFMGAITFNLIYMNDPLGSFPSFLSKTPATTLDVATQSTQYLGLQTFQLVATDSFTGLINDAVTVEISLYC